MLPVEAFVFKLVAVDADAAGAVAFDKVAALDHEVFDDAVELAVLVPNGDVPFPVLPRAELPEVLDRLWWNKVRDRDT